MASLGLTRETLYNKYLFQSEISCVKAGHTMCLEKIITAEVSGHISEHVNVIKAFHDVNSILYTVTYFPVYSNCNHAMRNCKKQKIKS